MGAADKAFYLKAEDYKRNLDPVGHYVQQAALMLSNNTPMSLEESKAFVIRQLGNKTAFPRISDPTIQFTRRLENGDRVMEEGTLKEYIYEAVKNNELIAPTLTTYIHPSIKKSLLVDYMEGNTKARSVAKKAGQAAKAAGNHELYVFKDKEQTNAKLGNNAVSGAHVSASTPLYNKSAHSTLTSNCRATAGYGNANNEKLITGNRHYRSANIVINNLVSIPSLTNLEELDKVMCKYMLVIPTVEDVVTCIRSSSDQYWHSPKSWDKIAKIIENMKPLERAAFVYVGDFFHLRKLNNDFIHTFITKLSTKIVPPNDFKAFDQILAGTIDSGYMELAHQICSVELCGKGKDYGAIKDTEELRILVATVNNIEAILNEHMDFIRVLFVSDNVPASVAYIPESIRKSALTGDTDSTIFTVQEWVDWYCKTDEFNEQTNAISATIIFLASQSIIHVLARMSANFGIVSERIFQINMKNEYKFDVFVPTNVAKHYFALITAKEGDIYSPEKYERQIKGVHLKSSNAPKGVTKAAEDMMTEIMDTIHAGKKIKITKILKTIGDIERNIDKDLKSGGFGYYRRGSIQIPESYTKSEEESPYVHYMLWQEVFAPKYGEYSPPPYQVYKFSTTLVNPTATREWLDSIEDRELAERMRGFMRKLDKTILPSILIPMEATNVVGIPKEIMAVIDTRKIVYDLCKIFYIILETLGFYIGDDKRTRLVSDTY